MSIATQFGTTKIRAPVSYAYYSGYLLTSRPRLVKMSYTKRTNVDTIYDNREGHQYG